PVSGLQDIFAGSSSLTVRRPVLRPSVAQAAAASHPAWPAPTTRTSNSGSGRFIHILSCVHMHESGCSPSPALLQVMPSTRICNSVHTSPRRDLLPDAEAAEDSIQQVLRQVLPGHL